MFSVLILFLVLMCGDFAIARTQHAIRAMAFSQTASKKILATGGDDNAVSIWTEKESSAGAQNDAPAFKLLRKLEGFAWVTLFPRQRVHF